MTCNDTDLRIAQYEDKDFDLYAYDVPVDESAVEGIGTRMDLSGGAICAFEVRDAAGNIMFTKTSAVPTEILIDPDQVTAATKGTAAMFIVRADTAGMTPGTVYYYDFWVFTNTGKWRRIIKKSRFHVEDGVYEPAP